MFEGVKRQERLKAIATWRARLSEERYARKRVVEAILPHFEAWMHRQTGRLTYRFTQIMTGHGCFGDYLCKIGREATVNCFHCGGQDQDSASHTLVTCPAWERERTVLISRISQNLSLPAVVSAMLSRDLRAKSFVRAKNSDTFTLMDRELYKLKNDIKGYMIVFMKAKNKTDAIIEQTTLFNINRFKI